MAASSRWSCCGLWLPRHVPLCPRCGALGVALVSLLGVAPSAAGCAQPGQPHPTDAAAVMRDSSSCGSGEFDDDPLCAGGLYGAPFGTPIGPASPAPDAVASATGPLPEPLRRVVEPWHALDAAAAHEATHWLVARYTPSTYPCVEGPDGSLDMIEQDSFSPELVIQGNVASPVVDLPLPSLRGPRFPRAYAEGRRYLLLLRPRAASTTLLADPKAVWTMANCLSANEVVAIVDLSATQPEAYAERMEATRTGERQGFRFEPARWRALRDASSLDATAHRALMAFLTTEVLRTGASLAAVRAWLGPPDVQLLRPNGARRDSYILGGPSYRNPTEGAIYGELVLAYDPRLELRSHELEYLRWRVEPKLSASSPLDAADIQRLGLPGSKPAP